MSDVQETAQLVAGKAFPTSILTGVISRTKLPSQSLCILNVTPYDGWLETVALEWPTQHPSFHMKTMSVGNSKISNVVDFCQKSIAMRLLEVHTGHLKNHCPSCWRSNSFSHITNKWMKSYGVLHAQLCDIPVGLEKEEALDGQRALV